MPSPEASRRNGQKGGRPPGSKNTTTIEKELYREELRRLVVADLEPMVRAQIAAAKGVSHFFQRNEDGKWVELVDPHAVLTALNSGEKDTYYWVHTQHPSTAAFADLLNRALDKPKEPAFEVSVQADLTLIERLEAGRKRAAADARKRGGQRR
jgi:hypothetical protein